MFTASHASAQLIVLTAQNIATFAIHAEQRFSRAAAGTPHSCDTRNRHDLHAASLCGQLELAATMRILDLAYLSHLTLILTDLGAAESRVSAGYTDWVSMIQKAQVLHEEAARLHGLALAEDPKFPLRRPRSRVLCPYQDPNNPNPILLGR